MKIKHPYGNAFRLGIPLLKRIVQFKNRQKSQTDHPLKPLLDGAPITVIFGKGGSIRYEYSAELVGNFIVVEDKGKLPIGNYSITVLMTDANGDPLRYKENMVFSIVDATADADYTDAGVYDGYFKFPILDFNGSAVSLIVITDDEVQMHEGEGFYGEITDDEVRLYARYGTSKTEITDDEVKIIIND